MANASNVQPIRKIMPFAPPLMSASLAGGELVLGAVAADDFVVVEAFGALKAARVAAENMTAATIAIHRDATKSPPAAHLQSDEYSAKLLTVTTPKLDRAHEHLQTSINLLQRKTAKPALEVSAKNNFMTGEVRARLAGMTQSARMKTLSDAIDAGDDLSVGAALEAPGFLTGLSPGELEHVRDRWAHARHPEHMACIKRLQTAQEHLRRAGNLLSGYQRQCSDAGIVTVAKKLQKQAQAAIAAAG
jgi:hypothetical protein